MQQTNENIGQNGSRLKKKKLHGSKDLLNRGLITEAEDHGNFCEEQEKLMMKGRGRRGEGWGKGEGKDQKVRR